MRGSACIVLLAFVFLLTSGGFSQSGLPPGTYTSTNKKAIKNFEKGRNHYENHQDKEAEHFLLKAIEDDPNFAEPHIALGYLYMERKEMEKAIEQLKSVVSIAPKYFPKCFYDLGLAELLSGKYSDAKSNLQSFLGTARIPQVLKDQANFYIKMADFAANAIKNPKPFTLVNMGTDINSADDEYFPSITADGKLLMFTRNVSGKDGSLQEDFYQSKKTGQGWSLSIPIREVNSNGNEGAPTLSADGKYMFFASCMNIMGNYGDETRKGFGSCDIFFTQISNGKWTRPVNIGPPVNTANWETQPSFSSDGKTLYFVRGLETKGGLKEQDIYVSTIDEKGNFGNPVKLGPNVNSSGREESVFIHPDNQTLYFSSDGRPESMGGLDIYLSRRQADGSWGPAVNLGYPINTVNDENSVLVNPNGQLAYFATNRSGGFGGLDLYQFDFPEDCRPQKISYIKGKVYDAKTSQPLSANIELIDLETQQTAVKSFSDDKGSFLTVLTSGKTYLVNVNRQKYLFYSDHFNFKNQVADYTKPIILDIPLQPIDTGMTIELRNIFFDVDKYDLKPESNAECNKLIDFLKTNPGIKIEISGHTDNDGNKKENQLLSENRAKAVFEAVVKGGISADRMKFKGYGDAKPLLPNTSAENKAKNRRTEVKVVLVG